MEPFLDLSCGAWSCRLGRSGGRRPVSRRPSGWGPGARRGRGWASSTRPSGSTASPSTPTSAAWRRRAGTGRTRGGPGRAWASSISPWVHSGPFSAGSGIGRLGDASGAAHGALSAAQAGSPLSSGAWVGQAVIAHSMAHADALDLFRHALSLRTTVWNSIRFMNFAKDECSEGPRSCRLPGPPLCQAQGGELLPGLRYYRAPCGAHGCGCGGATHEFAIPANLCPGSQEMMTKVLGRAAGSRTPRSWKPWTSGT